MIDKLRSHLRNQKGFTLIELLVVIAIIAILVIIVIVAINPVRRLQEATDSRVAADVRSAGTGIATCVTKELAAGSVASQVYGPQTGVDPVAIVEAGNSCGSWTWMGAAGRQYTSTQRPTDTGFTVENNAAQKICIYAPGGNVGGTNNWWVWTTTSGSAYSTTTTPVGVACGSLQ